MAISFLQPLGLWALALLIPLIILYLIKNKPRRRNIPSLMFLMKDKGQVNKLSFLKRFVKDYLLLIQLLLIGLLAFSISIPIMNIRYDATSENTVIVIDGSGSMNTKTGLQSRFNKATSAALGELSGTISVILAQETPIIVLEEGSKSEAADIIAKLTPRATTTSLEDGMILGLDLLNNQRGKIVVISDFIVNKLDDIGLARKTLISRGNKVKFIDVKGDIDKGNVGIIKLNVDKDNTEVFIKNFNDQQVVFDVKVLKEGKELNNLGIEIPAKSVLPVQFETISGLSEVKLNIKDDLDLDNVAYISTPERKKLDVLIITNEKGSSLQYALESSKNMWVNTVELPVVPSFDQDVIILHNFDKNLFLPGTFLDLKRFADKGGIFVLTHQDNLNEMDLSELEFVKLGGKSGKTVACITNVNEVTKHFGNNKCFAQVSDYFSVEQPEGLVTIVKAEDNTPLISHKGNIVFYNINDDKSDFNRVPSYPIFWDNFLRFLAGEESINGLNVPAGTMKVIEEQNVQTPYGAVLTNQILMDQSGLYEFSGKKIAVNMLSDMESNVYGSGVNFDDESIKEEFDSKTAREDFNIENLLIILGIILIFIELLFVKMRGDL